MKVHIFIINLRRSIDRRKYIQEVMRPLGLEYELVEAVDGATLSKEEKADIHHKAKIYPSKDKFNLLPGEIGCAMSHIKCYERIISEEIPHSIILEDDIYFTYPDAFLAFIKNIDTFKKYDLILLGLVNKFIDIQESLLNTAVTKNILRIGKKQIIPDTNNKFKIGFPTSFSATTMGYYLSLKGSKKIIQHAYPIRMPADILTGNSERYNLIMGVPNRLIMKQQMKLETTIRDVSLQRGGRIGRIFEFLFQRDSKLFKFFQYGYALLRCLHKLLRIYLAKFYILPYKKYAI